MLATVLRFPVDRHSPIQAKNTNAGATWFELDAGRAVCPPGLIRMKWAALQFVDAAPDLGSERLDTWLAKHMAAREDVLGNLAHATEASCVAKELGRFAEFGEEVLDLFSVQT